MKILELLMQSSDLYAPYTGVALTSCLENNKDMDRIIVHFLSDHVSDVNTDKLIRTVLAYGRSIHVYELNHIVQELEQAGFTKYHGSYTTLCKLFMLGSIHCETDRVLYIDSDTLCTGSLKGLLNINLDGYICAMAKEMNVLYQVKNKIPDVHNWYNAGVVLFHVDAWKKEQCVERIRSFVKEFKPKLRLADQDLINLLFRDRVRCLPQRYNYIYTYTLLPFSYGDKVWKWGRLRARELKKEKKLAVIYHCMPVFHLHPWDEGAYVPQMVPWDAYLELSQWGSDFEKVRKKQGCIGRIQEILYQKYPPFIYYLFYKLAIEWVSMQGAKGMPYARLLEQAEQFLSMMDKKWNIN